MTELRIAVAQTAPIVGDVRANVADATGRVAALAGQADLVIFPELFTTGYRRGGFDHRAFAEPIPGGPSLVELSKAAAAARVALIGTVLERADDAVYDTAIVLDANGELIARYRKTHLYPAEEPYFGAGDEMVIAPLGALRIGLAICFEHAFPEVFTELALAGANLIAIPSAVPAGYEHLLALRTRARAQDNQLYVAAANLAGFDGETRWCGGSIVVDPRGEVVAEIGEDAVGVFTATIDLDRIGEEREREPALVNRRPELYRHLSAGGVSNEPQQAG